MLVCIFYLFLRKGKFKNQLHKWIVAANTLLLTAAVPYGMLYIVEVFLSWYSGVEYEQYAFVNRVTGPYWWAYWYLILNSLLLPNLLWFKRVRHSAWFIPVYIIPALIEPVVILITSLHRDYLPSTWIMYHPFQISLVNLIVYVVLLVGLYYLIEWRKAKRALV